MNRILVRLLRFCLCRRVSFAQSSYWLINSYPAPGVQIVESATLHYLKAWNKLISSCFFYHLHRFWQRLASVFTTHHSPLTLKTPWEHFQRPPTLLVRFIVPSPPPRPITLASSLPSQLPTSQNLLALKPWSLIRSCTKVRFDQTSVLSCEISCICNNCGVD